MEIIPDPDKPPNPYPGYPDWSKTLLMILDYSITEGKERGLDRYLFLLELARKELLDQIPTPSQQSDEEER